MPTSLAIPILMAGGLILLTTKRKEPAPGAPPGVPEVPGVPSLPGQPMGTLEDYTEIRQMPEGPIRYFKQSMVGVIINMLKSSTLRPVAPPGGQTPSTAAFYEVVPWQAGAPLASDAVLMAQQRGMLVLGSLSLPLPISTGRMVVFTQPQYRLAATPTSAWVVLLDVAGAATGPVIPSGAPGAAPGMPPMPSGAPALPPFPAGAAPILPGMPGAPGVPGMPGAPWGMPPGGVTDEPWSAGMPPELAAKVREALADPTMEPEALDQMAALLDAKYPLAAAALRARASELRMERQMADARRGGSEHTIRAGDTGSYLAKYYTGNGNRWREIPPANPGMRTVTINGVTQLQPWNVGDTILLPLSWKIWEKPLPPLQTGSVPSGGGAPPPPDPDAPLLPGDYELPGQSTAETLASWLPI